MKPRLAPQLLHDEAEVAVYLDAFPFEEYEIYEVPDLGKFYIDDNPASVKEALRSGKPWEPHIIEEFKKYVVPGTTALDVGAHIGSLTVPLARLVGPKGRVYAFEPQMKVFRELFYNLRLNDLDNAVPLRYAASSEPGIIEMDPIRAHDGRVAIGRGGDRAEARTIDSFGFSDVSLIKIDVEGHEASVLKGAEKTIMTHHPVIFIEVWDKNLGVIRPMLEKLGYSLRQIRTIEYVATFGG
jgi:FkbM family methyltransferase